MGRGGARIVKSIRLPSVATYFYRDKEAMSACPRPSPSPPHVYCLYLYVLKSWFTLSASPTCSLYFDNYSTHCAQYHVTVPTIPIGTIALVGKNINSTKYN